MSLSIILLYLIVIPVQSHQAGFAYFFHEDTAGDSGHNEKQRRDIGRDIDGRALKKATEIFPRFSKKSFIFFKNAGALLVRFASNDE